MNSLLGIHGGYGGYGVYVDAAGNVTGGGGASVAETLAALKAKKGDVKDWYSSDDTPWHTDSTKKGGGGGGAAAAQGLIALIGQGVSLYSSIQNRKSVEAVAAARLAEAQAAGAISQAQSASTLAQVQAQLGLAETAGKIVGKKQMTYIILGLGGLITVSLIAALAIRSKKK